MEPNHSTQQTYEPLPHPVRITEQTWPAHIRPLVSIVCITYNHESFIKDCLEGFLMQETTFPVEILIHDDASTDRTPIIIRDYESRYPHLVKTIYQNNNKLSKGINVFTIFILPKLMGKYAALCEGDDFWIHPRKLATQIDLMEQHSEINLCFHPVYWLDDSTGNRFVTDYGSPGIKANYTLEELLIYSNFIPTCSTVYRSYIFKELPSWVFACPIGDLPLAIGSLLDAVTRQALFLPLPMGVYRRHAGGIHGGKSHLKNSKNLLATYEIFAVDSRLALLPAYKTGLAKWRLIYLEAVAHASSILSLPLNVYLAADGLACNQKIRFSLSLLAQRLIGEIRARIHQFYYVCKFHARKYLPKRTKEILRTLFRRRDDPNPLTILSQRINHSNMSGLQKESDAVLFSSIKIILNRAAEFTEARRFTGEGFFYRYANNGWPNLYATTYAAMFHGLSEDLSNGNVVNNKWSQFINSYQSSDGLYRDLMLENAIAEDEDWWGWRHLSAHVVTALTCLGARTNYPFHFLEPMYDAEVCHDWITHLPWREKPDFVSNTVMNYGVLLQYNRDYWGHKGAAKALDVIYAYLDSIQDPESGLWGYDKSGGAWGLSRAVQTAYHLWNLYFYDQRPVHYIEPAIDHLLKTQNELGGFGVPLNSSACEDIDSIDPLCRFSLLTDYRRDDIHNALRRALRWVPLNQMEDGGFVFRRFESFEYGHPLMATGPDESNLFATWFRMLSIAYITEILDPEHTETPRWQWVQCPGYQFWHAPATDAG